MSGCGKRTLDTMLLHKYCHFVGEVGISGITTEALDIIQVEGHIGSVVR